MKECFPSLTACGQNRKSQTVFTASDIGHQILPVSECSRHSLIVPSKHSALVVPHCLPRTPPLALTQSHAIGHPQAAQRLTTCCSCNWMIALLNTSRRSARTVSLSDNFPRQCNSELVVCVPVLVSARVIGLFIKLKNREHASQEHAGKEGTEGRLFMTCVLLFSK